MIKLLGIMTVLTVIFNYTETHRFEHSCLSAYSVWTLPLITHKIKSSSVLNKQSMLSPNETTYNGGVCVYVRTCSNHESGKLCKPRTNYLWLKKQSEIYVTFIKLTPIWWEEHRIVVFILAVNAVTTAL
jgi:hypothetical protein